MTKVCHMTSAHGPEDVRIFHKESVSLARAGYEVYLVERGDSYEKDGVQIVGVGEPDGGRLRRMTSFARKVYLKALEVDADIYHFHDPELLPYGRKLKRRGKKVIFDSHEHTAGAILEKAWIPYFIRKTIYSLFSRYQKRVCSRLDAVVTVNPPLVQYFSAFQKHTIQVANFPILKPESPSEAKTQPWLVFAGGISAQWNHDTLVKAIAEIPECRYRLCGWGTEAYLDTLRALPGWKQVDYLGKIPHSQVDEELGHGMAGMALLSPGRNTDGQNGTLGNTKIFEEMMAGLPVICTNFTSWRNFVEGYHCGICVNPQSVEEVAAAVRYLLEHPEEARRMGENSREAVEMEFNWGIEERKLLNLYRTLFPVQEEKTT